MLRVLTLKLPLKLQNKARFKQALVFFWPPDIINYRKRPCISRTFFSKLKPKIMGAAYPWIHLCLEFSKT